MDLNFYDNDFEEFLKQKSDQYKMYPSDRVWNNVYSSLHGRKKWWALGFMLFFITTGALVGSYLIQTDYDKVASDLNETIGTRLTQKTTTANAFLQNNSIQYTPVAPVNTAAVPARQQVAAITTAKDILTNNISSSSSTTEQEAPAAGTASPAARGTETYPLIENDLLAAFPQPDAREKSAVVVSALPLLLTNHLPLNSNIKGNQEITKKPVNQTDDAAALQPAKPSHFSIKLYASPTVSYRRLSNLDQQGTHVPLAGGYAGDINRYVRHKPAPGFELGTSIQYKLSSSLTLFAGAQLNYSRYYIDAFKYRTEKASITLDKAQVHDTLSGYTDIRNFSGYAPEQLQNKYLQLSVPVGMEIKLLGHKKLQFSVAGSLQPTFLLTSTSYLLTSDYKNYIQSPDLARTFNVHTNFEAILSYQAGGLKWQIGPQFRSQLLSSYSNQYRVREYLTEYGIKIGVIKTFR